MLFQTKEWLKQKRVFSNNNQKRANAKPKSPKWTPTTMTKSMMLWPGDEKEKITTNKIKTSTHHSQKNNKKQNKSTKTSTIITWMMRMSTTFLKTKRARLKVRRSLNHKLKRTKMRDCQKSMSGKSLNGSWSCLRTWNFMSRTTCCKFTKSYSNLTSQWSYRSSSLRFLTSNTIPSFPWPFKSKPTSPNSWNSWQWKRMSKNLSQWAEKTKKHQITKNYLKRKALIQKSMMMKSILTNNKTMKIKTYQ